MDAPVRRGPAGARWYNSRVSAPGPTISASEFARLSGVDRERLRTWERRHGFPSPVRPGGGARRYPVADLGEVVAVRRAVECGTPLAEAVAAVRGGHTADAVLPEAALAAATEAAPGPVVVVRGPEPLTVAYLNAAARRLRAAPAPGLPLEADATPAGLREAFATQRPRRATRPGRGGGRAVPVLLVPLSAPGALVAVYDLEPEGEREAREELARLEDERVATRAEDDRRGHLLETCSLVADRLRRLGGVEALTACTELLVRRLDAVDTALAPYMAGQLVIGRSTRGLLGPEMITVAAHEDLARVITRAEVAWAGPTASRAFGAPEDLAVMVVPVLGAGEPLAVLALLFEAEIALDTDLLRALEVVSTALGFALHQEQLVSSLPAVDGSGPGAHSRSGSP